MSRWIQNSALAMILLGLTATHARAGLVIDLSNVNVAPGGIGTMDISVTSSSSYTLSAFNLQLLITPSMGSGPLLAFTSAQANPYNNPNYVFAGQSYGLFIGFPFWGAPTTTIYNGDTIAGGDLANFITGPGYVSITGGSTEYLATVTFQAAPSAPVGAAFQVSLVNNPGETYFDDQNGNALNYTVNSVGGAVVTTAAVPEPTSLVLGAISSLGGLLWYCGRRRQRQSQSSRGRDAR